jgi:hypothetical protein
MIIAVKEYERLKEIEKTFLENQAHLKEKFEIKGNFYSFKLYNYTMVVISFYCYN